MTTFHRLKKEVGLKILKENNYSCTECKSKKSLCVHHIERKKTTDKDYNDESNLTVLCRSCHMRHHKLAGHIINPINKNGRRGKNVPPIKCKIDGCVNYQHGRKLCKKHYEFYRRRDWAGVQW